MAATTARANANIAGDPGLKFGRPDASYYRFGGVMKGGGATAPRAKKPIAMVQPAQRLMPPITESPNRQMSKYAAGGGLAAGGLGTPRITVFRHIGAGLYKPLKQFKPAGKSSLYADGGSIHIKPSHREKFIAYKARTGKTTVEAKHSSDPAVRKMATFAQNASHWGKGADGGSLDTLKGTPSPGMANHRNYNILPHNATFQ